MPTPRQDWYNVAAHVRTCSGTTRNRTRVSPFNSPVMYHYTTRRHIAIEAKSPSPAYLNYRYGLPRSGNLHQRAKGSCGRENEFWIPGYKLTDTLHRQLSLSKTPGAA
ncbi:hypothetical protein Bbelb_056370 [Branchiostoma belcheri]|nr:hypothetical protein Bbelb_056370 [Branchiostoma belcheri]